MTSALSPVRRSIKVSAPPGDAFRIFTETMDSWWPLATHSIDCERVTECVFEGAAGDQLSNKPRMRMKSEPRKNMTGPPVAVTASFARHYWTSEVTMRIAVLALFGLSALLVCLPAVAADPSGDRAVATFAGGCFWCMEPPFDTLDGVLSTTSGYTGGSVKDPTYKEVSAGGTGHTEAIQIVYDPARVTYERLLEVFWRNIDPTTADRQFCDRGTQYRSGIFVHDDGQRAAAETSKSSLEENKPFKGTIVTEITEAGPFYPAEDYHQDYYKKNPIRYKYYRYGCGRDKRLEDLWGP